MKIAALGGWSLRYEPEGAGRGAFVSAIAYPPRETAGWRATACNCRACQLYNRRWNAPPPVYS
jgi:hypothetical protein